MRVAYVTGGLMWPFMTVVNEMEVLEQMGWSILPLADFKRNFNENAPDIMIQWSRRGVFRPGYLTQIISILREMLTHPVRFVKMCWWVAYLAICNLTEFFKALYELPIACYFANHCRKFDAQHIHVHFASRSLSLGLMIGMLIKVPVSCTVHAFDIFTRSPKSLRPRLSKCCFVVAISNYNIQYLRETCGERIANLCHVIHCGIDTKRFTTIKRCPQHGLLVSVSRLYHKKGIDVAIEACAKLRDENVDFHFQIVGVGPQQGELEELIQSLGLENKVELLGQVSNDKLISLFSKACVFVLPCVRDRNGDMDGIPMAMMEAMACQVPVVSTTISGIPELVEDGVTGRLVHEKDADALAEALKELLGDMDKIERFGRVGRERVLKEFCIDRNAAMLRKLIEA